MSSGIIEAQKIEWQQELSDKVIELLYDGKGSHGVVRCGCYDLPKDIFETALKKKLESGIDVLEEYDRLIFMSWEWKNKHDFPGFHLMSKSDMNLVDKALNQKNFWNIYSIFSDKVISEIKYWAEETSNRYEYMQSYKYRRKEEFSELLKKKVKKRDGNKCTKCGSKLFLEVHHINPLEDGGDNSMENLVTLCHSHHVVAHRKLRKGGGK